MKERFTEESVLAVLDLDKKIRIEVDMSDYTTEEVLFIECEDGRWRLVAFLSKYLNEIKRNYEIYDKEMLAVIRGLENWRHLLKGTKFKFEVWTNYKNLEYIHESTEAEQKTSSFGILPIKIWLYLKGTKIEKADELSRRPDWKIGVEKDNENQVFIKNYWICSLAKVVIEGSEVEIVEK